MKPYATIAPAPNRTTGSKMCVPNSINLYEQPIYPKNLYLDREPMKHAEYRELVIQKQIELLHKRGIWVKPTSYEKENLVEVTPRQEEADS